MNPRLTVRRCLLALAFCALPAFATPVMDVRSDQLLFAANELKSTLGLTPNQLTFWNQVAGKATSLLRSRTLRREQLHLTAKARLADKTVELRDVAALIDAEAATTATEDKQLRELWLSVTDALTDPQRAMVSAELLSILERVDAPDRPSRGEHEQGKPPGGRGGRKGGMEGGHSGGGMDRM
jgi:hypothetical protein